MGWNHEPVAARRPRESGDKSDALQTLRAIRRRWAVAKRLECARLQRRFSNVGCDPMARPVHGKPPRPCRPCMRTMNPTESPSTALRAPSPPLYLFSAVARLVAQIFNLPYRRIIFGRVSEQSQALAHCDATQITNLRYGRVQLCATLNTHSHRMGEGEWSSVAQIVQPL